MSIKIKCWGENKPVRGTAHSAGIDLYNNGETVEVWSGRPVEVSTKTAIEIPKGYVGLVFVRSGLGFKGLNLINSCGVIDSDYRGEIKLKFTFTRPSLMKMNRPHEGQHFLTLGRGDRVAQIVIVPYLDLPIEFEDELSDTERGVGGFGSTGKR